MLPQLAMPISVKPRKKKEHASKRKAEQCSPDGHPSKRRLKYDSADHSTAQPTTIVSEEEAFKQKYAAEFEDSTRKTPF